MESASKVLRGMRGRSTLGLAVLAALALLAGPSGNEAAASKASLSRVERRLASIIDAQNAEAQALLERVVNINSGTHNLAGVREVGRIFEEQLGQLGFRTRWVDGKSFERAGHLVADHPAPGPRILLIGHLDTVFDSDSPFQKFERLRGNEARGPGIIDMKGGDVILVAALKALSSAVLLKRLNVVVVMTGDEEDSGRPLSEARAALVAAAKGAEFAIGFEDGDGDPHHAVTARRGSTSWRISVQGEPAHSSQIFREDVGAGAIFEAARILDAFRAQLAGEAHLTFNPGTILGGTKVDLDAAQGRGSASGKGNIIAARAEISGDLRALSREQFDSAQRRMQEIVEASLPHTRARIDFDEGYPPLAPSPGNDELLGLYDRVSLDLGFGAVTAVSPDKAGAADVAFVAEEVPKILDGVGLRGRDGHTPGEMADLSTLSIQTKRAAVLLYRLSQAPH
jgi:glutamate carboxypeptidase